ncbi:MAG: TIGR04086 family membrane protein [Firmicutes bacterium]|nr:TIGR04086 family membrane protein [Bacillota bacterium]
MKRKGHYRITWSPIKSSIFHTQTLDWNKEFGGDEEGKPAARTKRRLKPVAWPAKAGLNWRKKVVSRLVNPDLPTIEPVMRPAKRPARRSLIPTVSGEERQGFRLLAVDWLSVVWGWVGALVVTLAALAVAAFYVAFTPGSVYYLSTYLFLNKVVSPLLGGILAGVKTRQSGVMVGFWVGLGYGLIVLVFRLYAGLFSSFWTEAVTGMLASIFAGIVGTVLGATLSGGRKASEDRRGLAVE